MMATDIVKRQKCNGNIAVYTRYNDVNRIVRKGSAIIINKWNERF